MRHRVEYRDWRKHGLAGTAKVEVCEGRHDILDIQIARIEDKAWASEFIESKMGEGTSWFLTGKPEAVKEVWINELAVHDLI